MSRTPARPLTIAHRAGNKLSRLAPAFDAGADYAETDVWLHHGRLEVRHDKTAGPLPLLWDRWLVKPGWVSRLQLADVLLVAKGRGGLLLDFKGNEERLARAMAEEVERCGQADAVAVTGGWDHLDRFATFLPDAPRFYTIGSPRRLAEFRPRLRAGDIRGVSIDSRFLTRKMVEELLGAGVETVISWAVETAGTAHRLLEWGVGGITSGRPEVLAAVRDRDWERRSG